MFSIEPISILRGNSSLRPKELQPWFTDRLHIMTPDDVLKAPENGRSIWM